MPQQSSTGQQYRSPRWLLSAAVVLVIMLLGSILVSAILLQEGSEVTNADIQGQFQEQSPAVAHDELFMLTISLVVVIQLVSSYKLLKWVPYCALLVSSFGAIAFSAVCTVVENLIFQEVFNLIEHLAIMTSAALLVVWCGLVFGFKKREAA